MAWHEQKFSLTCRVCRYTFVKREYFDNHLKYKHPEGGGGAREGSLDEEAREKEDEEEEEEVVQVPIHDGARTDAGPKFSVTPTILRRRTKEQQCEPPLGRAKNARRVALGRAGDGAAAISCAGRSTQPATARAIQESAATKCRSPAAATTTTIELVPGRLEAGGGTVPAVADGGGGIHIVDDQGNVGRVVKVGEDTFMIVEQEGGHEAADGGGVVPVVVGIDDDDEDEEEEEEEGEGEEEEDSSPDAVQTLIDAVQELIHSHEAATDLAAHHHQAGGGGEASEPVGSVVLGDGLGEDETAVAVVVEEDGSQRLLGREELESLGLVHPVADVEEEEQEEEEEEEEEVSLVYQDVEEEEEEEGVTVLMQQQPQYIVLTEDQLVQL